MSNIRNDMENTMYIHVFMEDAKIPTTGRKAKVNNKKKNRYQN
jgi:hypothetical protein